MTLPDDIQAAARQLGQTLKDSEGVQAYQAAAELAAADEALREMEASLAELYAGLSAREQAGQVLSRAEINRYHTLREQVRRHPLFAAREAALQQVKFTFARASEAISGYLTVDFNALALPDDE